MDQYFDIDNLTQKPTLQDSRKKYCIAHAGLLHKQDTKV